MSEEYIPQLLTSEDVYSARFPATKFRDGYDQNQIDDYLDEVVRVLAYYEALNTSPESDVDLAYITVRGIDVREVDFDYTRMRVGYDQDAVDDYLDQVAATLEAYEQLYGIPSSDQRYQPLQVDGEALEAAAYQEASAAGELPSELAEAAETSIPITPNNGNLAGLSTPVSGTMPLNDPGLSTQMTLNQPSEEHAALEDAASPMFPPEQNLTDYPVYPESYPTAVNLVPPQMPISEYQEYSFPNYTAPASSAPDTDDIYALANNPAYPTQPLPANPWGEPISETNPDYPASPQPTSPDFIPTPDTVYDQLGTPLQGVPIDPNAAAFDSVMTTPEADVTPASTVNTPLWSPLADQQPQTADPQYQMEAAQAPLPFDSAPMPEPTAPEPTFNHEQPLSLDDELGDFLDFDEDTDVEELIGQPADENAAITAPAPDTPGSLQTEAMPVFPASPVSLPEVAYPVAPGVSSFPQVTDPAEIFSPSQPTSMSASGADNFSPSSPASFDTPVQPAFPQNPAFSEDFTTPADPPVSPLAEVTTPDLPAAGIDFSIPIAPVAPLSPTFPEQPSPAITADTQPDSKYTGFSVPATTQESATQLEETLSAELPPVTPIAGTALAAENLEPPRPAPIFNEENNARPLLQGEDPVEADMSGNFVPHFLAGYRTNLDTFTSVYGQRDDSDRAKSHREESLAKQAAQQRRRSITTSYLTTVMSSRPLGAENQVFVRLPDGREVPVTQASSDFDGVHLTIPHT